MKCSKCLVLCLRGCGISIDLCAVVEVVENECERVLKQCFGRLWRNRLKTPVYFLSLSHTFEMWFLKVRQSSSHLA